MRIQVKAPQLDTAFNELPREEAIEYAEEKIEKALSVFDIEPTTANVVLKTEGSTTDPVQKVYINANLRGETIIQTSHSRDIRRAIDRAADDLKRQVKKYKTRKIDYSRVRAGRAKREIQDTFDLIAENDENL